MIGFTLTGDWREILETDILFDKLRNFGCRSIELHLNPFNPAFSETLALARSLFNRGWNLTIHAPTDSDFNIAYYTESQDKVEFAYRTLLDVVYSLSVDYKQVVLINFHGGQGTCCREELLESARQFVHWLVPLLENRYTGLRMALELLPYDPAYIRVGDRQEDLLYVSEGLNSAHFGFCWDIGHLRRNRELFNYGSAPKPDFIQHVIHTHVHEVDARCRDHCPLGRGVFPAVNDLKYLLDAGYKGVYNLELSFELAAEFGDPLEELFNSVKLLGEIIGIN